MAHTVDIFSDVICPWCYVGKRRLEKAIAALEGQDVAVRWLPFQLNPQIPKEGISRREYRISKFGSWERSLELDAKMVAVGEEEGIHFAFDRMERTPNTLDAHRLIWLADKEGAPSPRPRRVYLPTAQGFAACETPLARRQTAGAPWMSPSADFVPPPE